MFFDLFFLGLLISPARDSLADLTSFLLSLGALEGLAGLPALQGGACRSMQCAFDCGFRIHLAGLGLGSSAFLSHHDSLGRVHHGSDGFQRLRALRLRASKSRHGQRRVSLIASLGCAALAKAA